LALKTTALLTVTLLRILEEEVLVRIAGASDSPWVFMPFESGRAAFAAAVAHGRVLVVGESGELALFDPATRACFRRSETDIRRNPRRRSGKLQGLILRGAHRAILYNDAGLTVVDCGTLDVIFEAQGLRPRKDGQDFDLVAETGTTDAADIRPIRIDPQPGLIEQADGTLIASASLFETSPEQGPVLYGLVVFDLARRIATRSIVQSEQTNAYRNHFRSFSPSGRYGVRFHYGSIPRHSGRGNWHYSEIVNRLRGKGGRSALPDCKLDGVERIGIALEIWQTRPLVPVAKPVVRMWPADSVWPHDSDVRYLKQIAEAIDFAATEPAENFPHDNNLRLGTIVSGPWRSMYSRIVGLTWEPDETGLWVYLWGGEIRRIGLDGRISPLITVPEVTQSRLAKYQGATYTTGDDSMRALGASRLRLSRGGDRILDLRLPEGAAGESSVVAAVESYTPGLPLDMPISQESSDKLAFLCRTTIDLPDLTEASVIAAIESLIQRLVTALPEMIHGQSSMSDALRSVFFTPTHVLDERTFFDFAGSQYPAAIPALHRLILTYCSLTLPKPHDRYGLLYGEYEGGALCHAALALARFDPGAAEVLTTYMMSGNIGQSGFIRDDLAPARFEHFGWQGEDEVRLGVRFAVHEEFHGSMGVRYLWEKFGLRDAARQIAPDAFVAILLAERRSPEREIAQHAVVTAWLGVLDANDPFDAAVRTILLSDQYGSDTDRKERIKATLNRIASAHHDSGEYDPEYPGFAFTALGVRAEARQQLSTTEFGELIAVCMTQISEGYEAVSAGRSLVVLRGIAAALDPQDAYDAEVIQVLIKAMNDAVAAGASTTNAKNFVARLCEFQLYHLGGPGKRDRKERCNVILDDLCVKLDGRSALNAEVISYLKQARATFTPSDWRG
jgi:hypothetical protein